MAQIQNNTHVSLFGNVGFGGLLFLVFLTLKLTGYITWSWWWVTAPLWIPVVVIIPIIILVCFVAILFGLFIKQ